MQIKITKKYGSCELELAIEAEDIKRGLFQASIFTQKDKCFKCQSEDIAIEGNKDDEQNLYIKRKCQKCGATSGLGTYKGGLGYFWKNWEIWAKGETKTSSTESKIRQTFSDGSPIPPEF